MNRAVLDRLWRWLPVVLWLGLVYCLSTEAFGSSHTQEVFGEWNYVLRKSAHVGVFAVLCYLMAGAFAPSDDNRLKSDVEDALYKAAMLAMICSVPWPCLDELHQRLVPGRSGRPEDVILDICGLPLGATVWIIVQHIRTWLVALQQSHPFLYRSLAGAASWVRGGVELGLIFAAGLFGFLYLHRSEDATNVNLLLGYLEISTLCAAAGAITGAVRAGIHLVTQAVVWGLQLEQGAPPNRRTTIAMS